MLTIELLGTLWSVRVNNGLLSKGRKSSNFCNNLNEENKTFKFEKRHVSATPVPSSVYGWNYNDEKYIAEN